MATYASFQVQMASIMDVLSKTALAEITKLVDNASAQLRLEMSRCQRENLTLKNKLLVMEGELKGARGCEDDTPDRSLNIAFEVKVCDEFRGAQHCKVAEKGSIVAAKRINDNEDRLSTGPAIDEHYVAVEEKEAVPDALEMKFEPVDGEQVWSESVLLSEGWLEEDPKRSQSLLEQKINEEDAYGTLGAAAANYGEGPLCKEEEEESNMQPCPAGDPERGLQAELKREQEGEPLTPGHLLPESAEGLEVVCTWSKATRSGMVREMPGHHQGSLEHRGVQSNDQFSPRHFRASQRLCSEENEGPTSHLKQQQNGRTYGLDGVLTEMAYPLVYQGERTGSAPCEVSFDMSAEAKSPRGIEGRQEFICACCGKTFPGSLELQTHEEQQCPGKQVGCSEFGKTFTYSSVLEKHQQIHSRKKPFACSGCTKTFSQWHALKAHKSIHTGQRSHVCTDCGKRFPYKSYLKIHQRVHTRERPFVCTQCGKSISQNSSLRTHQVTHTGAKCFRCTVCNKGFAYPHILKRHQRVHTGEKCLLCKLCCKLFDDADSLKKHQLTNHREKRFICPLCGKGFTSKRNLNSHQSVHTGEKPHSCKECGKSFAHQCNLKTHQRVHTGEKQHICTECGKSFVHLCSLKTHQRIHTGEKPHICAKCGKSFAHLNVLNHHQRVHTGEKPHICKECGRSFSQMCSLKSHQRVHTGEKPYSCDECGKSFAHLTVLKHHQRVHTGEKPHICDKCGKCFSQLCNLKTHQRVHTGEKPYGCTLCGKSYSRKYCLQKHMLTHS